MKNIGYADIFELISKNNMTRAAYYLEGSLYNDCYPFVVNRARRLPVYMRQEIFNDAFSKLLEDIMEGKFSYQDDRSFLSYFKKGCTFQFFKRIREINRRHNFVVFLEEIVRNITKEEIREEYHNTLTEFAEDKLNRYGIPLEPYDENDRYPQTLLQRAAEAFRKLGKSCKRILFLYLIMELSHREIAENLDNVKNEAVSRVMKQRCMERLIKIYNA